MILFMNLVSIENFEELKMFKNLSEIITTSINNIFHRLYKINKTVLNNKEISIIYKIIYNDIWRLNDALKVANSALLVTSVYETINNIFEEILVLCEDFELYELAANMVSIRKYWIEKITTINEE